MLYMNVVLGRENFQIPICCFKWVACIFIVFVTVENRKYCLLWNVERKQYKAETACPKTQDRIYNINLGKKNTLLWYMNVGWTCTVFRMQLLSSLRTMTWSVLKMLLQFQFSLEKKYKPMSIKQSTTLIHCLYEYKNQMQIKSFPKLHRPTGQFYLNSINRISYPRN